MKQLRKNIINLYGQQGEEWLAKLPMITTRLANHWRLHHLIAINNMTFNYVIKAMTNTNQAVVLKISFDKKNIENEITALHYFNGHGSIKLIDYHPKYNAILLQQAIPGITLKTLYQTQPDYVMNCYVSTMQKLHSKSLSSNHLYRHIRDWLYSIDKIQPNPDCKSQLKEKAIKLKEKLLSSITTPVLLHGDLHHDNILCHGEEWLAIDPQGIIGDPEFEIAAFDFMYINELADNINIKSIFASRVKLLASKSGLNAERIKNWVFVRLILMAAWHIEDNGDPSWAVKLAEKIY